MLEDHRRLGSLTISLRADKRGIDADHLAGLELSFPDLPFIVVTDSVAYVAGFADIEQTVQGRLVCVSVERRCVYAVYPGLSRQPVDVWFKPITVKFERISLFYFA